jgi:hypothetical protein
MVVVCLALLLFCFLEESESSLFQGSRDDQVFRLYPVILFPMPSLASGRNLL